MGFRNYIGKIEKERYDTIKDFEVIEELYDYYKVGDEEDPEDMYLSMLDFGIDSLHEMGKYVQMDVPSGCLKPFFSNKELNDKYTEDHDLFIGNKDFLKFVIEDYKEKSLDFYTKLLNPFQEDKNFLDSRKKEIGFPKDKVSYDFSSLTQDQINSIDEMISDIKYKISDISMGTYSNLDDGSDTIVNSWRFENAIFELVKIYKTMDWNKYYLVYYGY